MPLTAFPQGISSYGVPIIGGGSDRGATTTGNVFFVSSAIGNNSNYGGNGVDPSTPFSTLAYAISQCTASKGDVIYMMPGHAETIAAATTLALNKAGVRIIGLGNRNNRPTISFAGTDSLLSISAASISLENVILLAGIDEVVTALSISAAFARLFAVDIVETASKQFIQFLLTTAAGDDLIIEGCTHHQSTAPAANSLWIQLVGADRAKIRNNQFFITTTNSASSSVIESDTTAPVNILIAGNRIVQLGGASVVPINLVANSSGMICDNYVASPKTAIAGSIAAASCYCFENYVCHVVNKTGIYDPGVDS